MFYDPGVTDFWDATLSIITGAYPEFFSGGGLTLQLYIIYI